MFAARLGVGVSAAASQVKHVKNVKHRRDGTEGD